MPSLELYRIFKIVAEEGNLTRTSELLFISQPAVTKHIHNLENELKYTFNKEAKEIGELLEEYFVKTILGRKCQFKNSYPKLLIVTPPIVNEEVEYCKVADKYKGATQKSKELNEIYKNIAEEYNCYFLSNHGLETGIDGVHLTKDSHRKLAEALNIKIKEIYK